MTSLRIVLVMIEPPLPFGNPSARWFYVLLKGLVDRGHRVSALATCSKASESAEAAHLFPKPTYDLRCHAHSERSGVRAKLETLAQPYSYVFGPELRTALAAELHNGFDVLHLEHLWSGWLGMEYARQAFLNLHYLFEIDLADIRPRGLLDLGRRFATRRAERRLLRHYPTIGTLTPRLSARVRELAPHAQVHTIPLAFDISLYPFDDRPPPQRDPVVGLIGSFSWQPTYSAGVRLVTRLWPEIKRRAPNARLQLVGRSARAALGKFEDPPDIVIYEDVPDIFPYFATTDVLLYPTPQGSGMKVKVLEALALGVPVVTTTDGVEGLPAEDGTHAGVSDDDEGLIQRTVELLSDEDRRQEQRRAARALVESHCDPACALDRLESVYATILAR